MNDILRTGLTFEEFGLCYLIYKKNQSQLSGYQKRVQQIPLSVINSAIMKGMCMFSGSGEFKGKNLSRLKVTDRYIEIMGGEEETVENWIEEWINLWPRGVKSGGYLIRGNKRIAYSKMRMFMRDFPEFSKETIFEATKRYLTRMAVDGYRYCKLSHYFIYKESDSTLASECSAVLDEEENPIEETQDVYGESEL